MVKRSDAAKTVPGSGQDKWALALHPFRHVVHGEMLDLLVTEHGEDRESVTLDAMGVARLVDELLEWLGTNTARFM